MFNCHNSLLSPVTVLFIPTCYELTLLALLPAKKKPYLVIVSFMFNISVQSDFSCLFIQFGSLGIDILAACRFHNQQFPRLHRFTIETLHY